MKINVRIYWISAGRPGSFIISWTFIFYSLQTKVLEKELLLLFIRKMHHIEEVVLVLLDVLVQRAYDFARRTSSNCIWRDVRINYTACSDDDVITDSDAWQYDWPTSDKAVLTDSDCSVDDSLRILIRKIAYHTSRSVMCDECTVEWYRSSVTDSHQVRFWTEVSFTDYADIFAQVRTSIFLWGNVHAIFIRQTSRKSHCFRSFLDVRTQIR